MTRPRIDQVLTERALADSREKAQRLIRAGRVLVDGAVVDKPGRTVDPDAAVEVSATEPYVGRGGYKLSAGLDRFGLDPAGRVCLDVGSSTGGFTDVLLQRGAARVYAVDVGKGQLDYRLRTDERVVVMEGVNARYLAPDDLPERPTLAVVDVSFISLTKILPAVTQVLAGQADLVTLIKPQFEAGRAEVGRGGVVRDPAVREAVVERIRAWGTEHLAARWTGCCASPIKGPAGNIEYLAWWQKL